MLERLAGTICKRAFSSPEAFFYEWTIAPALARTLVPFFEREIIGLKLLDVGAGGGRLDQLLIELCGVSVVALDPSPAQNRRVNRLARRTPSLSAHFGSAEDMGFANDAFDCVISSCAWKHWLDPAAGITQCLRVLRPGGRLVVIELDGKSTATEFWQFARTSRIPWGLKRAYLRFAMRTVIGVAPTSFDLARSFGTNEVEVQRIPGQPFLLAVAVKSK
jgi:SAM-dependent methyltransferase